MTDIATNLNTIDGSLSDIKTAIVNKGGTVSGNITTFATAIDNIPSGGGSTPTERAVKANYWVDTSGVVHNLVSVNNNTLSANTTTVTVSTTTDRYYVGNNALGGDSTVSKVDLSSLEYVTFEASSGVTGPAIDIRNLSNLTAVDLSSIKKLTYVPYAGQTSYNPPIRIASCSNIETVDISELEELEGPSCMTSWFISNTKITTFSFLKLAILNGEHIFMSLFQNSAISTLFFPSLNSNSFGSYTNQFSNMLLGCSGVTVHFPSNLQSVIGSWIDVTGGFGGTNTTVLFDLPATN